MPAAARAFLDKMKQDSPHCHAPMHPPAPTPTPTPHPALPLVIIKGSPNVTINGKPAVRVGDTSIPCMMPVCVPGGPGMVAKGSATVTINMIPAAREDDVTAHTACLAPIPSPVGKIMGPCSPDVKIGG